MTARSITTEEAQAALDAPVTYERASKAIADLLKLKKAYPIFADQLHALARKMAETRDTLKAEEQRNSALDEELDTILAEFG